MKLIERYIFRQLLGPTVFATAALVGVALLSQGLDLLDLIVTSARPPVFLKIIASGCPAGRPDPAHRHSWPRWWR